MKNFFIKNKVAVIAIALVMCFSMVTIASAYVYVEEYSLLDKIVYTYLKIKSGDCDQNIDRLPDNVGEEMVGMTSMKIEDNFPYFRINGGYYSGLPIQTTDSITGGTMTDGTFTCTAGVCTGFSSMDISGTVSVGRFTQGGGILASTTGSINEVLSEAKLLAYSQLDYTLTGAANTLTTAATSTMTTFIPNAGDCAIFKIRNLSTTAASTTTITAGAGVEIHEASNGDETIAGLARGVLEFCRETDTDVTLYINEFIATD